MQIRSEKFDFLKISTKHPRHVHEDSSCDNLETSHARRSLELFIHSHSLDSGVYDRCNAFVLPTFAWVNIIRLENKRDLSSYISPLIEFCKNKHKRKQKLAKKKKKDILHKSSIKVDKQF